jgi:hypothetical protein
MILHWVEKAIEIAVLGLGGALAIGVCIIGYYDVEAQRHWKK